MVFRHYISCNNFFSCFFFLSCFLFTALEATSISLNQVYCVENQKAIYSTFFDKKLSKFKIISLPKNGSKFEVPTIQISSILKSKNISYLDKTNGTITFKRNCYITKELNLIRAEVENLYKKQYPCIKINKVEVLQKGPLPADFKSYQIKNAAINNSRLRQKTGTVNISFLTQQKREKKLYFKYLIDASTKVFKAKNNMYNDRILSKNDYEEIYTKIDKLPSNLISCKIHKNLIVKNYIKANSFLTHNKLEIKKDLLKGTTITSYLIDGSLVVEVETILLEDANVGDKVRVKSKKNKFFRAKIFSENGAMILQ